jgi:hypothetical protein
VTCTSMADRRVHGVSRYFLLVEDLIVLDPVEQSADGTVFHLHEL